MFVMLPVSFGEINGLRRRIEDGESSGVSGVVGGLN